MRDVSEWPTRRARSPRAATEPADVCEAAHSCVLQMFPCGMRAQGNAHVGSPELVRVESFPGMLTEQDPLEKVNV